MKSVYVRIVPNRGGSTCFQSVNVRCQAVFNFSSVPYFACSHSRNRSWLAGQKQNSGSDLYPTRAQFNAAGSLHKSHPYNASLFSACRATSWKNPSTAIRTFLLSKQNPGAACDGIGWPSCAAYRPSGYFEPTHSGAESTYTCTITFSPISSARRSSKSRFSRWYSPSRGSPTFHSTHVRTVLNPSPLILSRSSFHNLADSPFTCSSIGARAFPPLYHTDTGRKPAALEAALACPGRSATGAPLRAPPANPATVAQTPRSPDTFFHFIASPVN